MIKHIKASKYNRYFDQSNVVLVANTSNLLPIKLQAVLPNTFTKLEPVNFSLAIIVCTLEVTDLPLAATFAQRCPKLFVGQSTNWRTQVVHHKEIA